MKHFIITTVIIFSFSAADIYYTWPGIEVDKCASAWLIRRFIDKHAEFRVATKGDSVKGAIPFDIAHAEFRRQHGKTTFDVILEKNKLKESALSMIASIVKDAEINVWAKKRMEETVGLQRIIYGMSELFEDDLKCLEECMIIFDALREYYSNESKK